MRGIDAARVSPGARLQKVIQIKEAEHPTVRRPVVLTLNPNVRICLERAELVTESYARTEGEPWILRRAKALRHLLSNMTIYVSAGERIVGNYASTPDSLPTYPEFSCRWLEHGVKHEFAQNLDERGKLRLKRIARFWEGRSVESAFWKALPAELRQYVDWTGAVLTNNFWPLGMVVPDYANRVFPLGFRGMLDDARRRHRSLKRSDLEYRQKADFYTAVEISGQAMIAWVERYAKLACERANEVPPEDAEGYRVVAAVCARLATKPPRTFHDALQMFWFCHLASTQIAWCSVGLGQRFDQIFWPFYQRDKARGAIDYQHAVELFEHLWLKLDGLGQVNPLASSMVQVGGTKFQNVTIGGTDSEGRDASNELSYAVIDATMNVQTLQPNICLRYHDAIDPTLIDKAIDCIATGIGMPAIFNDDACIRRLLNNYRYYAEGVTDEAASLLESHLGFARARFLTRVARGVSAARRLGDRMLPKPALDRLEDLFHNLPYAALAGGGPTAVWIRKRLTRHHLVDIEAPLRVARDWASVACVAHGSPSGMVSRGSLTTVIMAGILNFLKCIEYVLYRGVEPENGERLGVDTGDPRSFTSYDEFLAAFLEQLRFQLEKLVRVYAVTERLYAERTPRPLGSLLLSTPVIRGRDATHQGETADVEVFTMASVNAADSLAAIKRLVFDDRVVTMDELVRACASNWEGHEVLRRRCLRAPKFGNDDDYADRILADMYRRAARVARHVRSHLGTSVRLEATLAAAYFFGGLSTGATPDGRSKGETVSDGQLSPMHGCDLHGPTAVLRSCSKVDPSRTWNQLFNQKIHPKFLRPENRRLFIDYLRTWYSFGNWHVQFNCQSAEELEDARIHPERHAGLIVRVAGYSARFIDLTPRLQADIIRRTEQDLGSARRRMDDRADPVRHR